MGWIFYGAHITARTFPALVITIIIGAAAFCCLGYALVSAIRNEDAAQPITQAIMLPLYFISGVFYPTSGLPTWLADVAKIFPVSHLASALLVAYNPHTTGAGFAWTDLAVLVLGGSAVPDRDAPLYLDAARTLAAARRGIFAGCA